MSGQGREGSGGEGGVLVFYCLPGVCMFFFQYLLPDGDVPADWGLGENSRGVMWKNRQ